LLILVELKKCGDNNNPKLGETLQPQIDGRQILTGRKTLKGAFGGKPPFCYAKYIKKVRSTE